jgi:hypothetical protein
MLRLLSCAALLVGLLAPTIVRAQAPGHFLVGVHGGFDFSDGSISGSDTDATDVSCSG